MKKLSRLSTNVEDVRGEDEETQLFKELNREAGFKNDVLKEPTRIKDQSNNEGKKFNPKANLTIKNNLPSLAHRDEVVSDPGPTSFSTSNTGLKGGFLKHTTVDHLKK